jgi:fructose-specific component phosphotransferase system IIB-like protein
MRSINANTTSSGSYGESMPHYSADMLAVPAFAESNQEAIEKLNNADLVVVQRLALANVIPRILEAQANGKVVVVDVDDAYHLMPETVRAYPFWHEGIITVEGKDGEPQQGKMQYPPVEQLEWGIKVAHGVTTPSPQIAKDWKKYVDNTWVVPNYIAAEHYLPFRSKQRKLTDTIVIGWGGSHSHFSSFKDSYVVEALRKVVIQDRRVRVKICGGDKNIGQMFRSINAFGGHFQEEKWVPHNEWPRLLSTFRIGIIPLTGRYDARRSWIKALEYTLMGIPWIGTKAPPTEELKDYGYQVTNNVQSWEKAIVHVIENYDEALERVDAGFEVAKQADVGEHYNQLIDIYTDIYETVKGKMPG